MQIGGDSLAVNLTVDLTKYDNRCIVGSKGKTIPNIKIGLWGSSDRFVAVQFENGAKLDILWDSLDVIN